MAAGWTEGRSAAGETSKEPASTAHRHRFGAALASIEDFAAKVKLSKSSSKRSASPLRPPKDNSSSISFSSPPPLHAEAASAPAAAAAAAAAAGSMCDGIHVVQGGDWLYSICRLHNVDLKSMLRANPGICDPDKLVIGSKIKIPLLRSSTPLSSSLSSTNSSMSSPSKQRLTIIAQSAKAISPLQNWLVNMVTARAALERLTIANLVEFTFRKTRMHTVGAGDSLEYVAARYGTTVESIKRLNKIRDDVIIEGSVLYIDKPQIGREGRRVPKWRLANVQERNAMMEDSAANLPSLPGSASFHTLRTIRSQRPGSRLKTIRVRFGDTLADLAQDNGLSIRELQRLNNLRNDSIYEGDVLAVADGPDGHHTPQIRRGVRRTYRPLFSRLSNGGGNLLGIGGPEMTPRVSSGGNSSPSDLNSGAKLEGRWKRKRSVRQSQNRLLRFNSPLMDGFVSSPFGWRWGAFHEGVDLAADQGTPILAADRGVVTFAGWSGGYGYLVTIQHDGGFATRYGHCCAIHSHVGQ
ncbi:hypothetical protein CBR_g49581, partial [Chara braunii]